MVKVISSMGRSNKPFVSVEVKGVAETIAYIRAKGLDVHDGADLGTFRGANLVQQEWQESIMGNRDEVRRVDTGDYANSPEVNKLGDSVYKVESRIPYSVWLEYGSVKLSPGLHMTNTVERNREAVKEAVEDAVANKLKSDKRDKG